MSSPYVPIRKRLYSIVPSDLNMGAQKSAVLMLKERSAIIVGSRECVKIDIQVAYISSLALLRGGIVT
jgi:hypothetical protein